MIIGSFQAIVIGTSAGGLAALSTILGGIPSSFSLPIFVVIHLPPDKTSVITEILQTKCKLKIKEAEDKEDILGGVVYFAPPDYHLLVEKTKVLSLSNEEPVFYSRPSIDVLFETAADAFGAHLIGIVLSGGNNDGSKGLARILAGGGTGFIQSPVDAYASAMPLAAIEACPAARVMELNDIGLTLQELAAP